MVKQKIHLKDKLKQLTALVLSLLMCTTALPISSVYAGQVGYSENNLDFTGSNTGDNTTFANEDDIPPWRDYKFGGFSASGFRTYIYNIEDGCFLESDTDSYRGYKAFDFVSYDEKTKNLYSKVSDDDWGKETIYGTLAPSEIASIGDDWPFKYDGTSYYFSKYCYHETGLDNVYHKNGMSSATEILTNKLKDNNAEDLSTFITDYWGSSVTSKFRTSNTLVICFEPIFICSATDTSQDDIITYDEDILSAAEQESQMIYLMESNPYPGTYVGEQTTEHNVYMAVTDGEQCNCYSKTQYLAYWDEYEHKSKTYRGNVSITPVKYTDSDFNPDWWDDDPYLDHVERYTWTETHQKATYKHFKYICGTAREMMWSRNILASNYDIVPAVNNAVFCKGIGKDGEFNSSYNLVFPDDPSASTPTYDGESNCLEVNGTPTTWGVAMIASKELSDCIWHTQISQSSVTSPNGAPTANGEGYPNQSGNYGSEIVVKIYEDVDKNTGEVVKLQTFLTSNIPSTIELETESESRKVYESCGEPGHDKCRTWINWISENRDKISECANTEYGEDEGGKYIIMPATGYTLEDWCTGERSGALASEMQRQGWSSNKSTYKVSALDGTNRQIDKPVWKDYTYEGQTRTLKKSSSGKGPTTITIGGNSQTDKSQSPSDDNIVYMRLVKYVDGSGNNEEEPTPVEANNDSVLTQSYLSNTASVNNLLSQDKSPQTFQFTDRALGGDYLSNDSLSLSAGIDVSAGRYVDLTLGTFNYNYNFTRPSRDAYKVNLGRQGQYFVIRRDSNSIKGIATGINVFNIDKKSGEWGNSEVTTPNGLISGIYGYDTDQVSYDNSEDNLNAGLSENAWSDEFSTSLENTSSDNYTASNTDESWTGLTTTLDTANAKTGIEEFKTTQSTKSSIIQNNSGVEGSIQVANSKTIRPIVKMQYSLINENGDNRDIEQKEVYVTSDVTRTFNVNSYAGIQMSNINGENLIVSSNMFSIDAMLTSGKESEGNWQLPGRVLKGGAAYSLSSENAITVNMTTVQLLEDTSNNYDSSNYVSFYSDNSLNITQENHTEFKDEAINNLKETYITQYLSDNIKDIRTPAYNDGVKISGSQEDIYSEDKGFNHTNPYTSTELQSDSKYWLSQEKETGNSSYFDIYDEKTEAHYYKFITDISGDVYMLDSSDSSFPSNKTTVVRILKQNEGIEQLSNQTAILLNKQTNVLDNMLSVVVRGVGDDTNNTWSDGTHYYNEYSEVTLVRYNTAVKISLQHPNKRTAVIDTHLQPESSSRLDAGTLAFKTAFKTNWNSLQEMSKFRGKSVYLKNADVMFHSKENIFIPNMSVQDNL